ncbi:MAG: AAA family ATPase [Bacteriovoracia bacterium]
MKKKIKDPVFEIQKKIIGRQKEIRQVLAAVQANRNLLIEGPVGVGKTVLAQTIANCLGRKVIRIDGDSRFTEQKLTGWFDPSLVLKRGYSAKTFVAGPLVNAMKQGAILFINELNRMPEAVQNILLPALDEGLVQVPQLGDVSAAEGFLLIATQNPREFVATSHLSEALMDRMEWVHLGYQTFEEECEIVKLRTGFSEEPYISWAIGLVRLTRNHPKIRRGASIRASIAIVEMLKSSMEAGKQLSEELFWDICKIAIPTRIELAEAEGNYEAQMEYLLKEMSEELKKNSTPSQQKPKLPISH